MNYRYFANPHAFSDYSAEAKRCDLCSEERAGYNGSFYGTADIEFVCEECLVGGRLQDMGSRTNEADVVSLRKQWRGLFPDHCEAQFESLVRRRTEEIEYCTPGVVTWQDYAWPAHCGDYCRYIKEVGLPDLECLSSDGNPRKFFQEHLHARRSLQTQSGQLVSGYKA